MRILGIDPGSRVTGYGIIEARGNKLKHIDNGGIYSNTKQNFFDRLLYIFEESSRLIQEYRPDCAAVESIFYAKNVQSTLKLGQARGSAVLALKKAGLSVAEFSPTEVKQAVTGFGRAPKAQIQEMVKRLLNIPEIAIEDASDALAVAITYASSYKFLSKTKRA